MKKTVLPMILATLVWALFWALLPSPMPVQAQSGQACLTQICGKGRHILSAATTNNTNVTTVPSALYSLVGVNTNTATYYLKLYDFAGTFSCNGSAVYLTYPIPGNGAATNAVSSLVVPFPVGMGFTSGIGMCITGGQADTDNSSAATGITIDFEYR